MTAAYEQHYGGLMDDVNRKLADLVPDPSDDGAEDVFRVGDRVRQWFCQRIGYSDLLRVSSSATPRSSD